MKKTTQLGFLCCIVYFISYITRIDYNTALAEIVKDMQVTKEVASYAVTGSFITYGAGQIISGILGDKYKPRNIIAIGLIGTSLINLAMVFLTDIFWMTAVWCFNGLFQAFMWPPLIRIMAENMPGDEYARTVKNVSIASSVATIVIYLIVPVSIAISSWRLTFVFAATCGLITAAVWYLSTKNIKQGMPAVKQKNVQGTSMKGTGILILLLPIMLAIVLQGTLRDGITTWMPSYINEVFNMGVSSAIMSTAVLPVFSILSLSAAAAVERKIGNPVKSGALLFGIGFAACAIMIPLFKNNVYICALLMAIITACMHGVNLMLVCNIPAYFEKFGKVSTISGVLNACTYVGSAASTYGFAVLADNFGWGFTVCGWAVIALAGTALCVFSIKQWKRFF